MISGHVLWFAIISYHMRLVSNHDMMMRWCDDISSDGVLSWWNEDMMTWWYGGQMIWWCGDVAMWWCDDLMIRWQHQGSWRLMTMDPSSWKVMTDDRSRVTDDSGLMMMTRCYDLVMLWCGDILMWRHDEVMMWGYDGMMKWESLGAVSYTHLTLPTIYSV